MKIYFQFLRSILLFNCFRWQEVWIKIRHFLFDVCFSSRFSLLCFHFFNEGKSCFLCFYSSFPEFLKVFQIYFQTSFPQIFLIFQFPFSIIPSTNELPIKTPLKTPDNLWNKISPHSIKPKKFQLYLKTHRQITHYSKTRKFQVQSSSFSNPPQTSLTAPLITFYFSTDNFESEKIFIA